MAERSDLVLGLKAEQGDVLRVLDKMAASLEKLEKRLDGVKKEGEKSAKKIESAFNKLSKKIGGFAKNMVKYAGVAGVGALTASIYKGVQAASRFETKMAEVSTLLGTKAGPKMEKFNKAIRDMAKTTSSTTEELAAGLYQVISAGTKGTEDAAGAMRLLDAANKMSVAGMSDVLSSVDVLTTALNAWGASADDATQFSDQMFKAIELGKLTLPDLSAGLGVVASAAAGAGIEFGEVNAALAAMTAAGVPPARAMTALNAIIRVASKGSKELNAAFGENVSTILRKDGLLGVMEKLQEVTNGDTIALQKLNIEQEAVTGLAVLAGTGIDKFRSSLEKMGEAAGSTESAYGKMTETFEFQKKRFWNVLNDMLIDIGTELMPQVLEAMEDISAWVMANGPAIKGFFQDVLTLLKGIAAVVKDIVEGLQTAAGMASILGKGQSDIQKAVAAAKAREAAAEAAGEEEELGGISGAELFGFRAPPGKPRRPPRPKGKRPKLLPEDISGVGTPFGAGFMASGVIEAIEKAGASAGFELVDKLHEKRDEVLKFADEFAAKGVDSWYQKIGGAELETIEERRAHAFAEAQAKSGFWNKVATGFAESLGEKLLGILESVMSAVFKPYEQIMNLFGMAMGGATVEDVKAQTEQMVQFWEALAENLGPVLDYLIDEGIPMILDAFIEHVPDIIDTLAAHIPDLIKVIIQHIPEIIAALAEGVARALEELLTFGGGGGFDIAEKWGKEVPVLGHIAGGIVDIGEGLGDFLGLWHTGGYVSKFADNVIDFRKAVKAHSGLFVRPSLGSDEIPSILQAGEGVIRKEVTAAMGGKPWVDAMNTGKVGGGDTYVIQFKPQHMFARDSAEVMDEMQSEMVRRGKGKMRRVINGGAVPGWRPRRA